MTDMLAFCAAAGVPITHDKTVGPDSRIIYLGIEIDAAQRVVRLPDGKLEELQTLLRSWIGRSKCIKRDLLSLIGSLSFAAKVVQPGRLFLRWLINLSMSVPKLFHFIYISKDARADILWWHRCLLQWNGIQLSYLQPLSSLDLALATDASRLGMDAVCGSRWFSVLCPRPSLTSILTR